METRLPTRWAALGAGRRADALANARRRIPVPSVDDRQAWSGLAVPLDEQGDWPHPRLSDYARYWRDGNRTAYEEAAAALRRRTAAAVLAAAATGQTGR